MVGLPRESRISRAITSTIALMRDFLVETTFVLAAGAFGCARCSEELRLHSRCHQLRFRKAGALDRGVELDERLQQLAHSLQGARVRAGRQRLCRGRGWL